MQFLVINDSFWHAVYKTESLLSIYCTAEEADIKSYYQYELFINIKSAEMGKLHRSHKSLFMLHQVHSQMEAYKLNHFDEKSVKFQREVDSLLGKTLRSLEKYKDLPTFRNIQKIRQELESSNESSTLRALVERVKFKYAHLKIIAIVNHLDPFTAKIYRNKEVRSIVKFLNSTQ